MQALNPVHHPPAPATYRVEKARQHGFTAIELMVVVAIVAILAALAAPSFTPLIERWRVRDAAENLTSTIYFARSEAIKRGGGITIDATGGWDQGWKVIHTENSITTDLKVNAALARVVATQSNGKVMLYVDRWGMLSEANGGAPTAMNILLKPTGKLDTDYSAIRLCIGAGGRIAQMKQGAACT
jgi:type IV fimbrial biogenesis protein FimT